MPVQHLEELKTMELKIWGSTLKTDLYFLYHLFTALKAGYSPIVIICGRQRSGKSFIALWLTQLLYNMRHKELILKDVIFYDPEEAMRKLEFKDKDVEWIDEPDFLDYQEWRDKTHRAIRSMINTQGYKNNLYIIICPFKAQIDRAIRVHSDFTIRAVKKGVLKSFRVHKKYDADDLKDATWSEFLDDISLSKLKAMKIINQDKLNEYEIYSREAKEKIRLQRMKAAPAEKDEVNEVDYLIDLCAKRELIKNG
jgi:hypothetical protein